MGADLRSSCARQERNEEAPLHGAQEASSMSLVNENVIPYCYVKMSSPALAAFCGGHEAGWIGSTDDHARDDAVEGGGVSTAGRHPISGGTPGGGQGAIVDPEPIVRARRWRARHCGGDRRSVLGGARSEEHTSELQS